MSAWDEIHIRQRVEISINVLSEKYTFGSIISRKNDSLIYFFMPSSQHSAKCFKKDAPADFTIHAEKKSISFTAPIAAIHPGQPPSVQVNRPPEDQLKVRSKGSDYGLKDNVPLTYRIMRDPVTPISDMKKGHTISIGPGDAVIYTIMKLTPGNYIELNYSLPPNNDQVTLVGKIEDCSEVKTGAQVSYESTIHYEVIRPGEQDKIVKYIFDKQRSLRKRGMY